MTRLAKSIAIALVSLASCTSAFAIPTVGDANQYDVTLGGLTADAYSFSLVNPAQGQTGNTAGFSTTFAATGTDDWTLLGKVDNSGLRQNAASFTYGDITIDFTKSTNTTGTWSITNNDTAHDATLDLVLAMHASSASTAFLFDNQSILAGQTLTGNWSIEWLNNGNNIPAFSNVAFFDRNLQLQSPLPAPPTPVTPPTSVPEPKSLALIGLGLLGMLAMLKRNKA